MNIATKLEAEATRCERIALGISNPELIGHLLAWAAEYRRHAVQLAPADR